MNVDGLTPGYTPAPTVTPPVEIVTDKEIKAKARTTGFKDGFLTILFTGVSSLVVLLGNFLLVNYTDIPLGKYEWLRMPLVVLLTALLKGTDRKIYTDKTTSATGLVSL